LEPNFSRTFKEFFTQISWAFQGLEKKTDKYFALVGWSFALNIHMQISLWTHLMPLLFFTVVYM
jgi:hypothetical protein